MQTGSPSKGGLRLIDSTLVKEPGKTGSLWRIHYSFRWPTLQCDYFKITAVEGNGNGESLRQFPLRPQDYILADRGYCQATGIHFAASKKAYVMVRLGFTPPYVSTGQQFQPTDFTDAYQRGNNAANSFVDTWDFWPELEHPVLELRATYQI